MTFLLFCLFNTILFLGLFYRMRTSCYNFLILMASKFFFGKEMVFALVVYMRIVVNHELIVF